MCPVTRRTPPRRAQQGDAILLVLASLIICMLGLVYALRGTILESQSVGNNLTRQKTAQMGDLALRLLEKNIINAYNGSPLELSAYNQVWWRDVTAGTAAPDAAYWAACLNNTDSTKRCGQLTLTLGTSTLPGSALAVVQPTGRIDPNGCAISQYQAIYYDIFIRTTDANGANGVNTETIYKLCIAS